MVSLQKYYPIWEKIDVNCDVISCPHYSSCCQIPTEIFRYTTSNAVNLWFIGQGGGEEEEVQHIPFIGAAGQRLRSIVEWILNEGKRFSVAFSNSVRCRPVQPHLLPIKKNRDPYQEEINICSRYLIRDILLLNPTVVIPLGNSATKALIPTAIGKIGIDRQNTFTVNINGKSQTMIPTYHPSFLIRNGRNFILDKPNEYDVKVKNDIYNILNYI